MYSSCKEILTIRTLYFGGYIIIILGNMISIKTTVWKGMVVLNILVGRALVTSTSAVSLCEEVSWLWSNIILTLGIGIERSTWTVFEYCYTCSIFPDVLFSIVGGSAGTRCYSYKIAGVWCARVLLRIMNKRQVILNRHIRHIKQVQILHSSHIVTAHWKRHQPRKWEGYISLGLSEIRVHVCCTTVHS